MLTGKLSDPIEVFRGGFPLFSQGWLPFSCFSQGNFATGLFFAQGWMSLGITSIGVLSLSHIQSLGLFPVSSFQMSIDPKDKFNLGTPRAFLLVLVCSFSLSVAVSPSMVMTENNHAVPIIISLLSFALYEDLSIAIVIMSVSLHFHASSFCTYQENKDKFGGSFVTFFISTYFIHYYLVFLGLWRPFIANRKDKLGQNGGFLNKGFIKGFEGFLWKFYACDPPYATRLVLQNDQVFNFILLWHIPIKFILTAIMGCEVMYYENNEDQSSNKLR